MKGCLALLVLMVALAAGGYVALLYTPMAGSFGLPIVVAVLFTLALANLHGLLLQVRRTLASKPPGQWSNGDFVAFSGTLSAGEQTIVAPASGTRCALYEYKLVRSERSGRNNSTTQTAFDGMAMAPSTVVGGGFGVRLVGFPLLGSVPEGSHDDHDSLLRFARHLLSATLLPRPESARAAIRQLGELLGDEDGVLRHDQESYYAFPLDEFREPPDPESDDADLAPEDRLVEHLLDRRYRVLEKVVPEGATVTAFGAYRSADRALDVGSGLSNLERGLELGEARGVAARNITKSTIALVVFAGSLSLLLWKLVPALAPTFRSTPYQGERVHFPELLSAVARRSVASGLFTRLEGSEDARVPIGLALRAGADPDARDGADRTMLFRCAERRDFELARFLLENGATVDAADALGRTPLHEAVSRRDLEMVGLLVDAGADPERADSSGSSPMAEARAMDEGTLVTRMQER